MLKKINGTVSDLQRLSLYPLILEEDQHYLATSSVETLVAVSHSIEELVAQYRYKGTFYAGFQRVSSFLPQLNSFTRLAAICSEALIFAYPDVPTPEIPGLQFINLEPEAPLAEEWFIVFAAPEFQIALLTRQVDSGASAGQAEFGRGRLYQGTVTTHPGLIVTARRALDEVLGRSSPDFLSELVHLDASENETPALHFSRKLTHYLEQRNQELRGLYRTLSQRTETLERLQETVRTMISRAAWQEAKAEEVAKLEAAPAPQEGAPALARQQTLTILFTDIEGFTALSESVPVPKLLPALNKYFDILATVVYGHGGDVDKFLGDGMLAFFVEPQAALQAAVRLQKRVKAFNAQQVAARQIHFVTRLSLVTGACILARVGSQDRQEVTILGDTVNLASRLEAFAPSGGLVMDEETYNRTGQPPALNYSVQIKGKSGPQSIYEVEAADLNKLRNFLQERSAA